MAGAELGQEAKVPLPTPFTRISGGFVVRVILSILITPWEEHRWLVILIVLGFSLIPIMVWCPIRLVSVRGSKNRYETELPSMRTRLETDRLS